MKEYQPYINPAFNLTELSLLINIPVHHLAYYFREIKKQPFTTYRNEWRVSYAKNLILEGKTSGLTLEAIGALSGFTNRNTFITVFKKIEGVPPGSYNGRLTAS
jgi:YesN/AraC family two-component response regulator